MLSVERREPLDIGGSFSPKNDGPLMTGRFSRGAALGGVGWVDAGAAGGTAGASAGRGPVVDPALCVAGTSTGAGSRVAPHIPQKRFVPGFSFPHRGQRTIPPLIAYDNSGIGCRAAPVAYGGND